MSVPYADTSAFVKLYVREPGTEVMLRLADPLAGNTIYVLGLTRVEFRSAVRLRERLGDLSHEVAEAVIARMDAHLRSLFKTQLVTEGVLEEAAALVDRHQLRAYDAVQLSGCRVLQSLLGEAVSFLCSDRSLVDAAAREGFEVINPAEDSE